MMSSSTGPREDARELIDGNRWEGTIAHELFHQWFGDLVTTESWSNLTLNESFANYSQVLWDEYKYGKDAGDAENYNDMQGYIQSQSDKKDLVRYYYEDKEAVFEAEDDRHRKQNWSHVTPLLRGYPTKCGRMRPNIGEAEVGVQRKCKKVGNGKKKG